MNEKTIGRPKKYGSRVGTQFQLEVDLAQRLREAADERDVSLSWMANKAIRQFLDRLLPVEEIRRSRDG